MFKLIIFFLLFSSQLFGSSVDEYFLTLRNETVNLRQGPSFEYPIKIFYKKKYLPVLVLDRSGNFRKIKDHENNSGWIHVSQLSKKKAAISIDENIMIFKSPTLFSKPLAVMEKGKLCLVIKCKKDWCKVNVGNYTGWVKKNSLWGRLF
jgi:SH3-like domain-containing protein